jgi:hypothetical protein
VCVCTCELEGRSRNRWQHQFWTAEWLYRRELLKKEKDSRHTIWNGICLLWSTSYILHYFKSSKQYHSPYYKRTLRFNTTVTKAGQWTQPCSRLFHILTSNFLQSILVPKDLSKKKLYLLHVKSRDSLVVIATGYGLDDRGSRVWFLAGAGNFSLHHRVQNGSEDHPDSCPMSTGRSIVLLCNLWNLIF